MTTRLCRLGVTNFTDLGEVVGIGDDLPGRHSVVRRDGHRSDPAGLLGVCRRRLELDARPEAPDHAGSSAAILQE